jgi:hypothetical protein
MSGYYYFSATGDGTISLSGSIHGLTNFNNEVQPYMFQYLFAGCNALIDISNLKFPATILREGCYKHMFNGCKNLSSIPSTLGNVKLAPYCYYGMFDGCRNLSTAL